MRASAGDACAPRLVSTDVVLPLALPGLIAAAIFTFILAWNDFLFALVLITTTAVTTLVWLATAVQMSLASGRFWHDRRARPEHPLPWTREKDPGAAHKLWDHLAAATATDSSKLAQAGRDSVADEHDIPARGQR